MRHPTESLSSMPADDAALADLFAPVSIADPSVSSSGPAPHVLFSSTVNEGGKSSTLSLSRDKNLYSIVCFETTTEIESVCAGFISGDTSRFCLRPAARTKAYNCCTTSKHVSDRFSLQPQSCYIVKNATSAFTSPKGDISQLSAEQIEDIKLTKRPMFEWQNFFTLQSNALIKAEPKGDQDTDRKLKLLDRKLILQTPAKVRSSARLKAESDGEKTFFDSEAVTKYEMPEEAITEWNTFPPSFQSFFTNLVQGFADSSTQSFGLMRDIRSLEKGQEGIGGDLETLDVRVQALQGQMGEVISLGDIEVPNITSGLGVLMEKIENNSKSLQDMSSVIKDNSET